MKKIALFCLGIISLIYNASSQESVLQYRGSGSYKYIERSDLRRYDNGKYVGLTSREIRSFIMHTLVHQTDTMKEISTLMKKPVAT